MNSDPCVCHLTACDSVTLHSDVSSPVLPSRRLSNDFCSHAVSCGTEIQQNPPEGAVSSWGFPFKDVQIVLGNSGGKKNPLMRTNEPSLSKEITGKIDSD